jgi:outer membrane protein OmpA-like peptidoglycan-associated protein
LNKFPGDFMKVDKLASNLIITAFFLSMTACNTTNPYTGESQISRALKYGAAGGAACALIGAGESGQRARNAGAGCAAIGAGIGAYMDAQEGELREQLAGSGVQVARNGDQLDLIMPGNVTFNTNEYNIRPEFNDVLASVALVLAKYPDTRLSVIGHTDSSGGADYNYNLSNRRAGSVANFLAQQGVDQNRVITQGAGSDQPIASNSTDSGRAQNRRVELHINAVQS